MHSELKKTLLRATTALKKAVAVVAEPATGRMRIGVPVSDDDPAYIHMLSLMTGDTHSRPELCASALVSSPCEAGPPVEAAAAVFGLTAGEIRVAERLVTGRTQAEIATVLALATPTGRSHLAIIFVAPIGRVTPAQ